MIMNNTTTLTDIDTTDVSTTDINKPVVDDMPTYDTTININLFEKCKNKFNINIYNKNKKILNIDGSFYIIETSDPPSIGMGDVTVFLVASYFVIRFPFFVGYVAIKWTYNKLLYQPFKWLYNLPCKNREFIDKKF